MLVKFPVCIVKEVRVSWSDGSAVSQYVTILEPGGGEYQFTARPNDSEYPCDALRSLGSFADQLVPCEIEADVSGFMFRRDGSPKQFLTLRKVSARPIAFKVDHSKSS